MGHPFIPVDRLTPTLFPASVDQYVPQGHLARFVVDIVEKLDLSVLERSYRGRGSRAYHPEMLLSVLFYGYSTGVFSSRKLEEATYDSIPFRYICCNQHPDHDTIASFRRRFLPVLKQTFAEILVIAQEMGKLKLGVVSLDGSKVKANASRHKALSYGHALRLEKQIRAEVKRLLEQAEQTDRQEDSEGLDLPDELLRREDRLRAIDEAKQRIEERARARYEQERREYEEKEETFRKREALSQRRGKKPKPPEEGPRSKDQVNLTDEDSRIMPQSGGSFDQSYNVQAVVDVKTNLIVGQHTTQATNDKKEVEPALETLIGLPAELGQVKVLLGDNGYYSEDNTKCVVAAGIEPLMAMGREKHNMPLEERLRIAKAPPEKATANEKMAYRLQTPEGRALYGKRKSTVEAVFGQIKRVLGFRQFMLRGLEAVSGEWTLVSMAYNLRRLHQLAE